MKFSVAYVKQNPVMFIAIFVVFGLLLYWVLNRHASAGSSVVLAGGGPSDAQLAAATQVQLAQIGTAGAAQQAQYQLAGMQYQTDSQERLAGLGLEAQLAQIQADRASNDTAIGASLAALQIQTNAQSHIVDANNQFMVDYASIAAGSATQQLQINATLQRDLGQQQLQAYTIGTMAGLATSLKSKGLAHSFFDGFLPGTTPSTPYVQGSGGHSGGGILGVLAGIVAPLPALVARIGG